MQEARNKFHKAISELKDSAEFTYEGAVPTNAEEYSKVKWKTGVDENNTTLTTTTNPHSELTWELVKTEMDKL